jgi:hypothetical protein
MGINFPNAPTVGQLYPQPPVAGVPIYRWDGEKWTTTGAPMAIDDLRWQALADQNFVVNGGMVIAQQYGLNNGMAGANAALYMADQFMCQMAGAGAGTWANGNTPNGLAGLPGYTNFLQLQTTTANASPAASDYTLIQQKIEGGRISKLQWGTPNAQPVTFGFWVNSSVAGTYGFVCRDTIAGASTTGQVFVTTYTINAANTWEWKTITLPGCTAGAWGAGLYVTFAGLMAGSSYTKAPSTSWQTITAALTATGAINFQSATGRTFQLTGAVMLQGNIIFPTADKLPLLMRTYDKDVALCFRYFQVYPQINFSGYGVTNQQIQAGFTFPIMRATPAASIFAVTYNNCYSATPFAPQANAVGLYFYITTGPNMAYCATGLVLDAR